MIQVEVPERLQKRLSNDDIGSQMTLEREGCHYNYTMEIFRNRSIQDSRRNY